MQRRDLAGLIVGPLAIAAIALVVASVRHAPHADGSPIDPRGVWHFVWLASAIGSLAIAGVGFVLARAGLLRLRTAVVVAIVLQALPIASPLLLSRDVYSYWAYARVVTVHHANPYRVVPNTFRADPARQVASAQWRTQTEPFGPTWVGVGALPALAANHSARRAQLLYRLLALACVLATIGLIAVRTRSAAGVVLLGWSPLVALHFAGGGHTDALLTLLLVAALLYERALGGALWPVATLVKAVPAVLLPLEVARRRLRMQQSFWLGLIIASVTAALLSTLAFGTGWASTSALAAHGTSPIGGVHFLTELGLRHRYAVVVSGLVFISLYVVLLRLAWVRRQTHLGLAAAALCMCISLLRPWYAIWPLALAALDDDNPSVIAAYSLAAYVLIADALPL